MPKNNQILSIDLFTDLRLHFTEVYHPQTMFLYHFRTATVNLDFQCVFIYR